ncbi:MAG: glutathione S-transferase N-terminal domain-containing protein [Archangium sp.]|nr:glutathione S-transferase N-terminal domain-containing protein [Archangium sp.]
MTVLRLTGRNGSHFTRVVRVVAHELKLPLELNVVTDLMSLDVKDYGGHPAFKIPTLQVEDALLFGTDNICNRLVELAGRADDPRVVRSRHLTTDLLRSAQELVWHAMSVQVQLIIGVRIAKLPAENAFFVKARLGLHGALAWLDERLDQVLAALPSPRDLSVFEVSLFCLVEHLEFRPMVPLDDFPGLRAFAKQFGERESAQLTAYRADR